MTDERKPFNPPRMSRHPIATLKINPRYLPMSKPTRERFALVLSTIGAEYLKCEHINTRTFVLAFPVDEPDTPQ